VTVDVSWWPPSASGDDTTVVTASYNTRELTALLLWSLHRVLSGERPDVVVVDNGSTDGSAELLSEAEAAGLCRVILNAENVHHGPALNQAFSWLAEQPSRPRWIWILDSDVVVARGEALSAPVALARHGAAVVGELHWDPWQEVDRFELYSLLVEPARIWQPSIGAFDDSGDPSWALLRSAAAAGVPHAEFPFTADGYVIHRGRSTLAVVAETGEEANPLYEWALDHNAPHFGGVPGADKTYDAILRAFRDDVPDVQANSLIDACRR